jgi:hypothetical protein
MKARPRAVERNVAKYLSIMFSQFQMSEVERIPVLGRTGPDITINELEWVIDVKSRIEVPKTFLPGGRFYYIFGDLVALRLSEVPILLTGQIIHLQRECPVSQNSVLISRWFDHMDEWTKKYRKNGISMLVLHRPRMAIADAALIFRLSDYSLIRSKL